jgi:parallel beta-helix repeat protein
MDLGSAIENKVINNTVNFCEHGISTSNFDNSSIYNNTIYECDIGIYFSSKSDMNNISYNTISVEHDGILLVDSNYNLITWNTFSQSDYCWREIDSMGNVFENNDCHVTSNPIPCFSIGMLISTLMLFGLVYLFLRKKRLP